MTESDDDSFELETAQKRAARTIDRNVTIGAGAGTGKTTTLTERYLTILRAHLDGPHTLAAADSDSPYEIPDDIEQLTDPDAARRLPERIVVTTFTERAAEELKRSIREKIRERLETIDDPDRWALWRAAADGIEAGYIDTTHGFCNRILNEYAIAHPNPAITPGIDVIENDDAAPLRQTVVAECIEREPPESAVLAQLFDRQKLIDVVTGLIAEREMTEQWIDEMNRLDNPDAYEAFLVELHPIEAEPATLLSAIEADLETLCELYGDDDVQEELGTRSMGSIGENMLSFHDQFEDVDIETASPIDQLSLCLRLCEILTSDGDAYAEGTYFGKKAFRTSEGPEATAFRDSMTAVCDTLKPETRPVDATLDADHKAHELLQALASLTDQAFDAYDSRKRKRGVVDYNDLIGYTREFLTTSGIVAADQLREDLMYVMVDEFQDTNSRQWELIQTLVTAPGDFDADSLCVVGDMKQSIYRFRDADVTVFNDATAVMQAANTANGTSECDPELTKNFRTLPETLRAINGLFDAVFGYGTTEPFEATSGPLAAGRETPTAVSPITEYIPVPVEQTLREQYLGADHDLTELPESEPADIEATAIANRIAGLLNDETPVTNDADEEDAPETRPIKPDDIAVLIRSRSDLKDYERALRTANLPYTVIKGEGFFETPEIRAISSLVEAITEPTDEIALYAALRSPLCGLADETIAAIHDPKRALWESLQEASDDTVQSVVEDFERWRAAAGTCSSVATPQIDSWVGFVDQILEETGYLTAVAADERGNSTIANIDKLRDKLREFDSSGLPTLERVVTQLSEQANHGGTDAEANDMTNETGVSIMTIHEAKGQEFPVVIVPGLGKGFNDKARISNGSVEFEYARVGDSRRPILGLNVPTDEGTDTEATMMRHVAQQRRRNEEHAEEKRVLYVACTRVEDHLILTGQHSADDDTPTGVALPEPDSPSSYSDWILPALFGLDDEAVDNWQTLEARGEFRTELSYGFDGVNKSGSITVRLPPETASYSHEPSPVDPQTHRTPYSYEQPWEFTLSASDLSRIPAGTVELQYDESTRQITTTPADSARESNSSRAQQSQSTREMPAAIHGHAVHRLCEMRPPRDKWEPVIRQAIDEQHERTPGVSISSYPTDAFVDIRREAKKAIQFIDGLHEELSVEATYDEYWCELSFTNGMVRGYIDHLIVTPDTYHIIDYKTDQKPADQSTEDFLQTRAEHHRPQLLVYAAALGHDDSTRDVSATLYFSAVEEPYTLSPNTLTGAKVSVDELLKNHFDEINIKVDGRIH